MSRLASTTRRAAGLPIVQDVAALVAIGLFIAVAAYWIAFVAMLVAAGRPGQ